MVGFKVRAFGEPSDLSKIKALVDAAFPNLSQYSPRMTLTINGSIDADYESGVVSILVGRNELSEPNSFVTNQPPLLRGSFVLSRGRFQQVEFDGTFVNGPELELVTRNAQAHPEWTTMELEVALRDVGARFAPSRRDEFILDLHLERFFRSLSALQLVDVTFRWRLGKKELGSDDVISPRWVVAVDTTDSGTSKACYALLFEPIGGHLRGIVPRTCPG